MLMGVLFADAMGRDIMPDMYRNEPGYRECRALKEIMD